MPPLATSSAVSAVVFATYGCVLNISKGNNHKASYQDYLLAGLAAGIPAAVILCPTELIKITQQARSKEKLRTWDIIMSYKNSGRLSHMFLGFWPTLFREVPAYGIYFLSYEMISDTLKTSSMSPLVLSFVSGALAGVCSWTVVYPMDVIKTNMQLLPVSPANTPNTNATILNMMVNLKAKYGWRVFFRGFDIAILRALPVNAVVFPCYNFTKDCLEQL